jgi:helix-turn-helix protein
VIEKWEVREQIYKKDIYKFIRRTPEYIKKNFPQIHLQISEIVEKSREEQKRMKVENLKRTIKQVYNSHGRIDYIALSEILGITEKTLINRYNKLIKQTLSEIERGTF